MKLSNDIADFYIKREILTGEKREIFRFGLNLIGGAILNYMIILSIALAFHHLVFGITFLICFYCTRVFCGGYHAKTVWMCRLVFIGTFVMILLGGTYFTRFSMLIMIFSNIFLLIMVIILAPIEHPNRLLTEELSVKGKRDGLLITCLFICIEIFLHYMSRPESLIIALTLLAVAILMPVGLYANRKGGVVNE